MPRERYLTEAEREYVLAHYKQETIRQMSQALGIAWATLEKRMREMDLDFALQNREWAEADVAILRELAKEYTTAEIAKKMGRTANSIRICARRRGILLEKSPRTWTEADRDYLRRNWGKLSVATLAKNLCREPKAIHQMARKMGMPPVWANSEDITLREFSEATGIQRDVIVRHLAVDHDFPIKKKKISTKSSYWYVDWEMILDWMKTHQEFYDGSKIKEDFFIPEPEWLTEKRRRDRAEKEHLDYQIRKRPWTKGDEDKARYLLGIGMTHPQIARELGRSTKAVAVRLSKLGLAYRLEKYYKGSDFRYIREHWEAMSDQELGEKLHHSAKSIGEARRSLGLYRGNRKKET